MKTKLKYALAVLLLSLGVSTQSVAFIHKNPDVQVKYCFEIPYSGKEILDLGLDKVIGIITQEAAKNVPKEYLKQKTTNVVMYMKATAPTTVCMHYKSL